jgi:hypothetical protein
MRSDDLVPLLAGTPSLSVGIRQGVIVAWDALTGENTVSVAGTEMTNLNFLSNGTIPNYVAGDSVSIMTYASTWTIIGKNHSPGS